MSTASKIVVIISFSSQLVQVSQKIVYLFFVERVIERRHNSASCENRLSNLFVRCGGAARQGPLTKQTGKLWGLY